MESLYPLHNMLLVSMNYPAQKSISEYLNGIFGGRIRLEACMIGEIPKIDLSRYSLVLFSSEDTADRCRELLDENTKGLTCQRRIDLNRLDCIFQIPLGKEVYVINDTPNNTEEVIRQLRELGITQYQFIPWYPQCGVSIPPGSEVITVGEPYLVPAEIQDAIDIGSRVVDISTVFEIIMHFNLPVTLANDVMRHYSRHSMKLLASSISQMDTIYRSQQFAQMIMQNIDNGVCLTDVDGNIEMCNEIFQQMLCMEEKLIGKNLEELLRESRLCSGLYDFVHEQKIIHNQKGQRLMAHIKKILDSQSQEAFIMSVDYAEEISSKEIAIRRDAKKDREKRLYTFDDYLTASEKVWRLLDKAERIAAFDSDVLIQGESGTGKEIIAQAIHNSSSRRGHPFIAVNFASIQPSLLESELFGYEEGSFTGAKKGGKKGLFERAHKGTIFLDEIGDAPLAFQTSLLRTLQERAIRRVGGTELIPIDVRVIAATNQKLYQLIGEGSFRQDLFFRISVLPLETIPLRDRPCDIRLLLDHYLNRFCGQRAVSTEEICSGPLTEFLESYNWPGNVRELMNICQYFSCIALPGERLEIKDLPDYMLQNLSEPDSLSQVERQIVDIIAANPKIGRNGIQKLLLRDGVHMTEAQVRTILRRLADQAVIRVNKTRGGCEVR